MDANLMKNKVVIKKSGISSNGLFAMKDFEKGDLIYCYNKGRVISSVEIGKLSQKEKDHLDKIGKNEFEIIEPPACCVNHSCEPNIKEKGRRAYALRGIKRGEEITIDYDKIACLEKPFECNCKTRNCRRLIIGKSHMVHKNGVQKDKIMGTILLTSAGMNVKEEILKILPKPANKIKLAHITTAKNPRLEENPDYIIKEKKIMAELGFQVEDIDIKGKKEDDLRKMFADKDAIYVQGGNSFYLLKYVRESSFDKVVKELISKGIIYIGVSAGSYIACPTIEVAGWLHGDDNAVGLTDLKAMNLVPFLIKAHYNPGYKEVVIKGIKNSKYPVRILTDDQAILIKDGKAELVGRGKEIKL